MKQEILFVLLKDFADWEGAYIAPYLNYGCGPDIESKYVVKTVSVTKAPVVSCGGFTVLPNYSIPPIMPESSTYWINKGFAKNDKFLNLL